MELPVGWSILLIVVALWNLIIWPQFFKRVARDDRARDADGNPTRFYTVHVVLVGVSLALGISVGLLGILAVVSR